MARSVKEGLDYFPVDCHMEDKIKLIEAKYGMEGFGVIIKLYQKIYANGYYIKWQQENLLLFANEINVDINRLNDIINDSLQWEILNKGLFSSFCILTSHGIQVRYAEATRRRKKVRIYRDYSLLEKDEKNNNIIYVDIKDKDVNINSLNVDKSTQSKVKESKVKESKVKESKRYSPVKKQDGASKIPYAEIVKFLNDKTDSKYRTTTRKTKELIKARWNEGFKLKDFKKVIEIKTEDWINDKKMKKFLRPVTLFGTKFESYLNQKIDEPQEETIDDYYGRGYQ